MEFEERFSDVPEADALCVLVKDAVRLAQEEHENPQGDLGRIHQLGEGWVGDEALAIAQIFGDYRVPVTSTKSQTGHEMWMAGASEMIYSMLMMQNGFIAGNINFENPDEETAALNVIPETKEQAFDMFLSNSFGFGGTNSTLIVKKYQK